MSETVTTSPQTTNLTMTKPVNELEASNFIMNKISEQLSEILRRQEALGTE